MDITLRTPAPKWAVSIGVPVAAMQEKQKLLPRSENNQRMRKVL